MDPDQVLLVPRSARGAHLPADKDLHLLPLALAGELPDARIELREALARRQQPNLLAEPGRQHPRHGGARAARVGSWGVAAAWQQLSQGRSHHVLGIRLQGIGASQDTELGEGGAAAAQKSRRRLCRLQLRQGAHARQRRMRFCCLGRLTQRGGTSASRERGQQTEVCQGEVLIIHKAGLGALPAERRREWGGRPAAIQWFELQRQLN
mmetsp:Transcript_27370/g.86997  ORF Transcript_27370/g.86997 Transcript_27370/m.86997 type:complete len:208 (-) Transcript_27370:84-707(-)